MGLPSTIPNSIAPTPFSTTRPWGGLPVHCSLEPVVLGYPDQALKRIQEALTLAQELSHPFSLALALFFAAMSVSSAGRGKQQKSGQRR